MATVHPDHDFNNTWGTILGVSELDYRPRSSQLMKKFWDDPLAAERSYESVLAQYTAMFEDFFHGTLPFSFHEHTTDANNPATLVSMLLRLAIFSQSSRQTYSAQTSGPCDRENAARLLGWEPVHLQTPRLAAIEGTFAAPYGPLASLSVPPSWRNASAGPESVQIKILNQTKDEIRCSLIKARDRGCVGVVAEIVLNQYKGRVMTPSELGNLREACTEAGMFLALDEVITAIRCGAPFAHQRPEYAHIAAPDLVFFGKSLGVNGTGVNFHAPFMRTRLGISKKEDKLLAATIWQNSTTQPVRLPNLINALGILEMAVVGDWAGRSKIIGRHLRDIITTHAFRLSESTTQQKTEMRWKNEQDSGEDILGGLESFVFIRADVSRSLMVMPAVNMDATTNWLRWLPRMDEPLTKKEYLESLLLQSRSFGDLRKSWARSLEAEGLKPRWCFWCGNGARNITLPWCRTCCINTCDAEGCLRHLMEHHCLNELE